MTTAELAKHDGHDGRSAYIAVSGTIYDVSSSPRWQNGLHEGVHQAGQDLTEALKSAPHVRTLIERFPVIGRLEKQIESTPQKKPPVALIIGIIVVVLTLVALLI